MATTTINYSAKSLSNALSPGIQAIIAQEFDKLVDDAVLEFKNKLIESMAPNVKILMEKYLEHDKYSIVVNISTKD